jgi:hypothetical protein
MSALQNKRQPIWVNEWMSSSGTWLSTFRQQRAELNISHWRRKCRPATCLGASATLL